MTVQKQRTSLAGSLLRILSVWGLLLLIIVLIVVFSILKPDTFPTLFNLQSILSNKSIQVLLALAVMIPMAANNFDLSVGYVVGIAQVLAIGLQVNQGLSWPLAALLILLLGAFVGLINGLLVTRAHIDSFIATLGTGTVLYGLDEWYTGGTQVTGTLQPGFGNLAATIGGPHGIPAPAVYVIIVSLALWAVFDYLPLGRYIYVLGANPRAAELNGISAARYVTITFIAGATLAAFAGVVLEAELRVGQSSVGPEYLLPSFTGALLGATSVKPGRVNVWGTILAVGVLSITVAGLQQLGAPFFVEQIFNGTMLVVAVGLAVYATRRRAGSRSQPPAPAGVGTAPAVQQPDTS